MEATLHSQTSARPRAAAATALLVRAGLPSVAAGLASKPSGAVRHPHVQPHDDGHTALPVLTRRLSGGVIAPQMPSRLGWGTAHARQSSRTGQTAQMALAASISGL